MNEPTLILWGDLDMFLHRKAPSYISLGREPRKAQLLPVVVSHRCENELETFTKFFPEAAKLPDIANRLVSRP